MRTLNLIIISFVISSFYTCSSKENKEQFQLQTTAVKVNTVVCGSCAKNIEKAVGALEGVQEVKVDVEKKVATVSFLPAKTDLHTIESSIAHAGYDANNTKRDPEAFEKLDECCKIDG